jgi:serralysin
MLFTRLFDDAATAQTEQAAFSSLALSGCNCTACAGSASTGIQGGFVPGTQAAGSAAAGVPTAGAVALVSGSQWTSTDPAGKTVITYSFANAGSQFSEDAASYASTLMAFSAADVTMTRTLLANISAVCNVVFVEVPDTGAQGGQVRYAYSQAPNDMGYAGFAFFPSTPGTGGDVWIGKNQAAPQWDYYRADLVLHETLHAIGLKHPFSEGVTLDTQSDIIPNTVMSYSAMAGSQSGALSKYPTEPMLLDIAALQSLYGAASHNAGDTVYALADASFRSGFRALWDSAGNDTLDAGGLGQGVVLDLGEGARSDIGVKVTANAYYGAGAARTLSTTAYTETLTIASGAHIENATGSAFADVITGNALVNVLRGGDGDDLLDGGAGNDQLFGGNGNDTVRVAGGAKMIDGGAGNDKVVFAGSVNGFTVTQGADFYSVTSLADRSVTTVRNVERIEFADMQLEPGNAPSAAVQDKQYAEAFRLYKAALDRAPDQEGLIFQTHALQSGLALSQLADNFMASPEFTQRFGNPGDTEFVRLLYSNVLDRAPDALGLAYHVARLDGGSATRADVLVGFSESPENQANVAATLTGLGMAGMLFPV